MGLRRFVKERQVLIANLNPPRLQCPDPSADHVNAKGHERDEHADRQAWREREDEAADGGHLGEHDREQDR